MKIAIVGAGGMGRAWTHTIQAMAEAQVTLFVDPLIGSEREPAWIHQFPAVKKAPTLRDVAPGEVDAVIVTAASPAHDELITQALELGCHVLVEKPFTTTLASAQRVVEQAEKANLTLMVSQNYRFLDGTTYVRRLVEEGTYGALRSLSGRFHCDHPGRPYQQQMDHPMLLEMAIHHLDFARAVSGAEAITGNVVEWTSARSPYRMGGGVEALYVMEGSSGNFPFSYTGSLITNVPRTPWGGIWRFEFDETTVVVDVVDGRYGVYKGRDEQLEYLAPFEEDVIPALVRVFDHFATCVQSGQEPWCSGRDNLLTLRMALGFFKCKRQIAHTFLVS